MSKTLGSFGRRIDYLRISLTDQCNFRCLYCMPPEGLSTLPKESHLNCEEILRFSRLAVSLGIRRIRLTGGEPLIRKDLLEIIQGLSEIPELEDLALTTNGSHLEKLAPALKESGLKRLNISLDSLNAESFSKITLNNSFDKVMNGIDAAKKVGFPLKVNVVVMKGVNDHEVVDFARFAARKNLEVRFIEFMPLCGTGWKPELVHPLDEVKKSIEKEFDFVELERKHGDVAQEYKITPANPSHSFSCDHDYSNSKVGFITTITDPFCGSCSRIRLSADGMIRPCLFSNLGFSVRETLQAGTDKEVMKCIQTAVANKPVSNEFQTKKESGIHFSNHQQGHNGDESPMIRSIGG